MDVIVDALVLEIRIRLDWIVPEQFPQKSYDIVVVVFGNRSYINQISYRFLQSRAAVLATVSKRTQSK